MDILSKFEIPSAHSCHVNAIQVNNLTKYYGDFLAVNSITFTVKKGEIFGFLGPNGAGKTTTIRMLTGILEPTSGEIRIFGEELKKNVVKIKERMGIVPEMANPYIDLNAMQNLMLIGKLYGMKKREIKERGEELLRLFGIYERRDRKVRSFSKGLRQRLSLAMALLPDPDLLFLDEPTSGLDVMSARLIKRVIKKEYASGKTIFLSTHNMNDANELCNRIAIINHGKIIAIDTPERIRSIGERHTVVEVSLVPFKFDEKKIKGADSVEKIGEKIIIRTREPDDVIKSVVKYAEMEGIKIKSLVTKKPSLEDVFVYLVGGKNE